MAAANHTQAPPRRRARAAWIIPLLLAAWTAGMLALTMAPLEEVRAGISFSITKLGHTVLFFGWTVLAGLYVMVFRGNWGVRLVPLLIAGTLFGVAIELAQLLLPFGRSARLLDVVMNAIGAAAGCLVLQRVRRRYGE
ncbi:MAG: VanZ family protein [Spirochaetaceae bacterium]|nr:MAG: VanZ family protein [Spirochaetaceae bacterium]